VSFVRRSRTARVVLRLAFAIAACEITLRAAAFVLERFGGTGEAARGGSAILCIGDSNTFGIGAPAGRSYPDQLRERLRAAGDVREVVNLGFPGLNSSQIVDRLERSLDLATPACVLFLAGYNDWCHAEALVGAPDSVASDPGRLESILSRSMTIRMLGTAWRVVCGDRAQRAFGGEPQHLLPEPTTVPFEEWDAEYARAKELSFDDLARWIRFDWVVGLPARVDRTLADLRARPDFAAVKETLGYPFSAYEWDADLIAGRAPRRLGDEIAATPAGRQFAHYVAAWKALAAGKTEMLRVSLPKVALLGTDPWASVMEELLIAWTRLVDRDYRAAAEELAIVADRSSALSPEVGLGPAIGGAALATLLADDSARLETFRAAHPDFDAEAAEMSRPAAKEWVALAICVDALKSGDAKQVNDAFERAARRCGGRPATEALAWLFDHRDASLERIRVELPIGAPRLTWIGETGRVFRVIGGEEFRRVTRIADRRLVELARRHHFPVVVLTYLNYEAEMQNGRLRELAAENGWALADFERRFTRAELGADDKTRYFSPDRGHPDEAGYRLMAQAIFETMTNAQLVRAGR